MKHGITRLSAGDEPFHEISADEFDSIAKATGQLVRVTQIEEKYDILLDNYIEFERELLDLTLGHLVFTDLEYSTFSSDKRLINRRFANLATTARLYLDHLQHDLSALYGSDSGLRAAIDTAVKSAYDDSLAFRAVEALRNYLQHRGLPISRLSYGSRLLPLGASGAVVCPHRIVPCLDLEALKADSKFKRSVSDELQKLGPDINVTRLVRRYVERVGGIQAQLRSVLAADIQTWRTTIEDALAIARSLPFRDLHIIAAVQLDDAGKVANKRLLTKDLLDHFDGLVRKNHTVQGLAASYVTGDCEGAA